MFIILAVAIATAPRTITVQPGNTLSGIAQQYEGHSDLWPGICQANHITDCNLIYPGQRITLEGDPTPAARVIPATVATDPKTYGGRLTYQGLESLWRSAGGASWAAPVAACIAEHESGGNQYATGLAGERGYWQINPVNDGAVIDGYTIEATYDPWANARDAVLMSGNGTNWSSWTTAPYCT